MIRYCTHCREDVCMRGMSAGCGRLGRVYVNPSTAGHISEASKTSRRHGAIKFHNQLLSPQEIYSEEGESSSPVQSCAADLVAGHHGC